MRMDLGKARQGNNKHMNKMHKMTWVIVAQLTVTWLYVFSIEIYWTTRYTMTLVVMKPFSNIVEYITYLLWRSYQRIFNYNFSYRNKMTTILL